MRKHSNQVELDQFFNAINDNKQDSQQITKPAFFQARKQLLNCACIEFNRLLIDGVYKNMNYLQAWNGFRLRAIDGTSIQLPDEAGITDHFGVQI